MGNEQGIPNDHIFFRFIDDQNYKMNFILLISSFIVFLISLIGALILSHRVAGPVYRLKMHLDSSVLTGEKKEVTFRKGDFFMELQDAFNEYIKRSKN